MSKQTIEAYQRHLLENPNEPHEEDETPRRIVVVGGPGRGKSYYAASTGLPHFCGDPLSKVKEPMVGVHYLPENVPFNGDDGAAAWIAANWFTMPGAWVCEGHVMARALRRWAVSHYNGFPCDRVLVLSGKGRRAVQTPGQETMHKGVMTVWAGIAWRYRSISQTSL